MKLHHHPGSSNARKTVMAAHVLGAPVELVVCDLTKGAQRAPAFLALNPNAMVPVLEDGDFALTESHAIMQYLADKTPGQSLYPTELRARADVNRWLFWAAGHWGVAIAGLNFENFLKGMFGIGEPDGPQVKRHESAFHQWAKVLDAHLAGRAWVSGEALTLADLAIAAPLMYVRVAKIPAEGYANIMAWFARIQELEAWKATEMKR